MMDSYERLANSIVLQAVKDYRFALRRLQKYPYTNSALYMKRETERFFWSELFSILTAIDPEMLIRKLNEEMVL